MWGTEFETELDVVRLARHSRIPGRCRGRARCVEPLRSQSSVSCLILLQNQSLNVDFVTKSSHTLAFAHT